MNEPAHLPRTPASRAAYRALRAAGVRGAAVGPALQVLEQRPRNHLAVVQAFSELMGLDLQTTYNFLLRSRALPLPQCAGCRRPFSLGDSHPFRFHLSDRGTIALCDPYCKGGRPSKIPPPELPEPPRPRSAG